MDQTTSARAFRHIRAAGTAGITASDLQGKLRVSERTVSRVIGELVASGRVVRPTPKGAVYAAEHAPRASRQKAAPGKPRRSRSRRSADTDWQRAWAWIRKHRVIEGAFGLAVLLGILRPRRIAEHQGDALATFYRAGGKARDIAERAFAGLQLMGLAQHASGDPEERQRQLARAELAAAERELRQRVQWHDNLAAAAKAAPGPRMVSGLEALGIIRPLPVPEPATGVPVMPLEPNRQLGASRRPMKAVATGVDPPTQLWEPGPNFSFDYAPLREVATPGCILYRQQLPQVAGLHLQQAQVGVEAMTGPAAALPPTAD